MERLRKTVGQTFEADDERYTFSWAGKSKAYELIQQTSHGTLVPKIDDSVDFTSTKHVFIEGDNLEVLKIIQKSYFKKVKMVYLDPPYNKGSDAIYNDSFKESERAYWEKTGTMQDGIKLTTNMESQGRFHSAWLTFMFSRMFIARNLLRDDGVIFVSIGDNEIHNLRILMDEVFGSENFVGCFVWEGGRKNDAKFVSVTHDYVLCYANDYPLLRANDTTWRVRKEGLDTIYKKVEELKRIHKDDYEAVTEKLKEWYRGLDKKDPAWAHKHYNHVDERGVFFPSDISWPGGGGPMYSIYHPQTKKPVKVPSRGWRHPNKETMIKQIKNGNILFGKDETSVPCVKKYLHNVEDQVLGSVFYKDRRNASKQLTKLMDGDVFDNPKDPEILQNFIRATTSGDDIILDFFAGSGSTAQAVLDQNSEDGQNRKFICVQIEEATPNNSIARKKGYATISAIAKERLRRVVDNIKAVNGFEEADLGFKVFCLTKSHFVTWERYTGNDVKQLQKQIALFESTLKDRSNPIDVIYECILREGMDLNSSIKNCNSSSNGIYKITDGEKTFFLTLAKSVDLKSIELLLLAHNDVLICRDSALDDSQKANISSICRLKTV